MAEVQPAAPGKGRSGKQRSKKIAFRLDMTPMVDLAFLLLTFFMLTTTFAEPNVMQLNMPVDSTDTTPVPESGAMTIILGKAHQVYYYFGLNNPEDKSVKVPKIKTTTFAANGIRQVLFQRQQKSPVTVLIKPSTDAKYQDMVDILDEMNITNQKKYALVKISQADLALVEKTAL